MFRGYENENQIVLLNSGFQNIEVTLPDEIGHALHLKHTFDISYPIFPNRISFETDCLINTIKIRMGVPVFDKSYTYACVTFEINAGLVLVLNKREGNRWKRIDQ